MNRNVGESMKNKTGIYTLRTAVILLLMITLALTASCIPAFAAEAPLLESADGDACFCKKTGGKNRRKKQAKMDKLQKLPGTKKRCWRLFLNKRRQALLKSQIILI